MDLFSGNIVLVVRLEDLVVVVQLLWQTDTVWNRNARACHLQGSKEEFGSKVSISIIQQQK